MDSMSFREALLADYIAKVQCMTREELLQEVIDLKYRVLESCSDTDLIKNQYVESRHKAI
jgi:hypothetical protein